jgi:O-antigen/teichoic acid export membrane protein
MMSLPLAGNCSDRHRNASDRSPFKEAWLSGVRGYICAFRSKGFPVRFNLMRKLTDSRHARQSALFFLSQAANTVLGIVVYSMLARALTVEEFGAYTFVTTFVVFTTYFFDFGLSSSAMRLMAVVEPGKAARERLGALLGFAMAIGALYGVFFLLSSFVIDAFFPGKLGSLFVLLAPLAVVYPVQEVLLSAGQGSNRIAFLSVLYLAPRILLCIAILLLIVLGGMTLVWSLSATMGTILISVALSAMHLRPSFTRIREEARVVVHEMKEFGREVYAGRVIDAFANGTDRMMISYAHGMAVQGFYSIAKTLSAPISMMSRSIATSSYQRFASEDRLSRKILVMNFAWCFGLGVALLIACELFVPMLFTTRYAEALSVLPWLIVAGMVSGLNAPYHAFLSAKRRGRAIKILSISTSLVNVAITVVLVPFISSIGAAIALIVSATLNIAMNLRYYSKYLVELAAESRA